MLTIGIPILNRYDLFPEVLDSIQTSLKNSDHINSYEIIVYDNGGQFNNAYKAGFYERFSWMHSTVVTAPVNHGVAKAWNYFLMHAKYDNILIINDDILLEPYTIAEMTKTKGLLIACGKIPVPNAFSCFLIRKDILSIVGYFDEEISPNYAYYEDNDYYRRMELKGIEISRANCGAVHLHDGSNTLKGYGKKEMIAHHIKFNAATANYIRKWGGLPGKEKYTLPFNGA